MAAAVASVLGAKNLSHAAGLMVVMADEEVM